MQTHRPDEPDVQEYLEEIVWRTIQALHYDDALLVKLPLDRKIYDDAFGRARGLGLSERSIVYLEGIVQRFPRDYDIGNILRNLGAAQADLAEKYRDLKMTERSEHFFELAEANFRRSIAANNTALGHLLLAELLVATDREEEALADYASAKSLSTSRDEEALIEFDLATIAMMHERFDEALSHFMRVAEINPDYDGIWLNIGIAYRGLKNYTEAETYLKRALEAKPKDLAPYVELTNLYVVTGQTAKAYETVEQGLRLHPQSAQLRALLAAVYMDRNDRRRAQAALEEAERINSDLEIVRSIRNIFNTNTRRK